MTQFYALRTRPTRPAMMVEGLNERERASFARHAAYLKRLATEGAAVFAGRTRDSGLNGWAVGIFKAESEEAARLLMTEDPFVQDGVVEAQLFPFDIVLLEAKNA